MIAKTQRQIPRNILQLAMRRMDALEPHPREVLHLLVQLVHALPLLCNLPLHAVGVSKAICR